MINNAISSKRKSLIDLAYCKATNTNKFFNHGIGDKPYLDWLSSRIDDEIPVKEVEIHWGKKRRFSNIEITDGLFESPAEEFLPNESKKVFIRKIMPLRNDASTPIVMQFAGTGDVGFSRRSFFLANPLARRGIGSILLENPFYGKRKPINQTSFYINNVSDLFKLAHAAVEEGRSLLKHFWDSGHRKIALTGMSMGGQTSIFTGLYSPYPVAIIPCVTPHSPEPVFMDEVLSDSINWTAISRDLPKNDNNAELYMRNLFSKFDMRNFPAPMDTNLIHIVAGKYDAYVPLHSAQLLSKALGGSKFTLFNGGHIASVLFYSSKLRNIIIDTLKLIQD